MLSPIAISMVLFIVFLYVFVTFKMKTIIRMYMKLFIYALVFIALFFPDIKFFRPTETLTFNIKIYAIVLCGIEVFELGIKCYVRRRKQEKRPVSKKLERIFESL